jgi:uncharacterized protein (TIGR04255 family)
MALPHRRLPKYHNPPVIEVVCCIYFNQMPAFQAAHLGSFWKRISKEYPVSQTQPELPPLASSNFGFGQIIFGGIMGAVMGGAPFPRAWFISEDSRHLVQVQADRLVFNWRANPDNANYPSFRAVIRRFKAVFKKFSTFVASSNLGEVNISALELIYVNHIDRAHGFNGVSELSNLIKDFSFHADGDRVLETIKALSVSSKFELPDNDGELNISMQPSQNAITGDQLVRLDLLARRFGTVANIDEAWNWFDIAHAWIVHGFTDLTTPAAHQIWEKYK